MFGQERGVCKCMNMNHIQEMMSDELLKPSEIPKNGTKQKTPSNFNFR